MANGRDRRELELSAVVAFERFGVGEFHGGLSQMERTWAEHGAESGSRVNRGRDGCGCGLALGDWPTCTCTSLDSGDGPQDGRYPCLG